MTYYKIVKDGQVVDAGFTFLKWNDRHHILTGCEPKEAQFIQSEDGQTVYHVQWLNPVPQGLKDKYETVDAVIIDAQEYDDLKAVLDSGETVEADVEEENIVEAQPEETDTEDVVQEEEEKPMTVQQMREKITALEEQNNMLLECLLEMSQVVYDG